MAGSGGSATAGSGGSATAGSAGVGGSAMAGSGGSATAGSGGSGNAGSGGSGGGATTGQWVLGYYVGYQINDYPIAQIDWSGLTHIAFAPMLVNANGTLDLGFSDSNGTGPADAKALSAAAHAHGVKALLMLGGAGAGGNIAANATPAKVGALADTLLAGMDQLGYDGIDLDWEDSVNVDDLIALAQQLRAKRPGVVLSYPAGAINGNFQTVDPKMVTLAKSLDRFNVQTYYPSTAVAGQGWDSWFVAPLSGKTGATPIAIDDTLDRYATAGIPKDKLGMGMAFYAICYTGGITGPHQPTNGTTQQIVGGDNNYPLSRFFEANGTFDKSAAGEKKVDAASSVPYLSLAAAVNDAGCGASTRYISYDDETSILAKGAFSKSNGYGGIIVWTIQEGWLKPNAAGGRAQNALMQALKQGFLLPGGTLCTDIHDDRGRRLYGVRVRFAGAPPPEQLIPRLSASGFRRGGAGLRSSGGLPKAGCGDSSRSATCAADFVRGRGLAPAGVAAATSSTQTRDRTERDSAIVGTHRPQPALRLTSSGSRSTIEVLPHDHSSPTRRLQGAPLDRGPPSAAHVAGGAERFGEDERAGRDRAAQRAHAGCTVAGAGRRSRGLAPGAARRRAISADARRSRYRGTAECVAVVDRPRRTTHRWVPVRRRSSGDVGLG
jgi:chitinase